MVTRGPAAHFAVGPSSVTTLVAHGGAPPLTESVLYGVQETLLQPLVQRIAASEELVSAWMGSSEKQLDILSERCHRQHQDVSDLAAGQTRLEAWLQEQLRELRGMVSVATLDELQCSSHQQQETIHSMESSIEHLEKANLLCAKDAEMNVRLDGIVKDVAQMRADSEQQLSAMHEALDSTLLELRGHFEELHRQHSHNHEDIRDANNRAVTDSTQAANPVGFLLEPARRELMDTADRTGKDLERVEALLSGNTSELRASLCRLEEDIRSAMHRNELEAAKGHEDLTASFTARSEALARSLERSEAALRGFICESSAAHSKVEQQVKGSLHRAEREIAKTREEVMNSNADLKELSAKLDMHLDRLEVQRRTDLEEATRQRLELGQNIHGLVEELDRSVQETRAQLTALDGDLQETRKETARGLLGGTEELGAEAALRELISQVDANRCRAEEEVWAALRTLEAQAARERDDVDTSLKAIDASLCEKVEHAERLRHQEFEELQGYVRASGAQAKELLEDASRNAQAAHAKLSQVDAEQTTARLRALSALEARVDALLLDLGNLKAGASCVEAAESQGLDAEPADLAQLRSAVSEAAESTRRQEGRLGELEGALLAERDCRKSLESILAMGFNFGGPDAHAGPRGQEARVGCKGEAARDAAGGDAPRQDQVARRAPSLAHVPSPQQTPGLRKRVGRPEKQPPCVATGLQA